MKKVDWIVHYVLDQYGPGGIRNGHTHGMELYGHLDFQLVLPLSQEQMALFLNTICLHVQAGTRFEVGNYPEDNKVFSSSFRLIKVRETGRDVLRLIIPDPKFRYPEEPLCEAPYKYQTVTGFAER